MKWTSDRLYELLPAIHRIRDNENGEGLRALCDVLAQQIDLVEADVDRMLDNWFIETCDEWVVPYIGDLLAVRNLPSAHTVGFSQRARVANTMAYRRRKGTATMLEQLARDTTGWPARVVEFFELLITTQNLNHLRPNNQAAVDLRKSEALELIGTAFDSVSRTVDVRHIATRRGKYNLPNVGMYLSRLQAYPLTRVSAHPVGGGISGRFTFDPLGQDSHLFNSPLPETEITHLAEEINLPVPLRRGPLYEELRALRQDSPRMTNYFRDRPVFQLQLEDESSPVEPADICICDLTEWRAPDTAHGIRAAVDPVLGRMTFDPNSAPKSVVVDYAYGFAGDVGAGPYDRREGSPGVTQATWIVGVSQELPSEPGRIFNTLGDAIDAWNALPPQTVGRILILDSRTYEGSLNGPRQIKIPAGSQLAIAAATRDEGAALQDAVPKGNRPHVRGNISIQGFASADAAVPSKLLINGLLIEGNLEITAGGLSQLQLWHATIVPVAGKLLVNGTNEQLEIGLIRSIVGTIEIPAANTIKNLLARDCIIDGQLLTNGTLTAGPTIEAPSTKVELKSCTLLGSSTVQILEASNTLFTQSVSVARRQVGCVRFSYLAENSITGRRYRCQPDLALSLVAGKKSQEVVQVRLRPAFTSRQFGHPGYCQLRLSVPVEIRTGAEDESEMGVFGFLKQAQRETNLLASLDEYLRFGLEAGIQYTT